MLVIAVLRRSPRLRPDQRTTRGHRPELPRSVLGCPRALPLADRNRRYAGWSGRTSNLSSLIRFGCGTLLFVGEIELTPDDSRLPGRLLELVGPEPLPGPGEILDVNVDEGSVRAVDVAVDRPVRHAIGQALLSLRPVASKPHLEVFRFDTGHHFRHDLPPR